MSEVLEGLKFGLGIFRIFSGSCTRKSVRLGEKQETKLHDKLLESMKV